jgi:hypothetical protein
VRFGEIEDFGRGLVVGIGGDWWWFRVGGFYLFSSY